jgi:hypothetical protein
MTRRQDVLIATHQVRSPDGREFEVQEIQEYLLSGGDRIPSFKRYQQPNGRGVNLLKNGDFELVSIGVTASPI